METNGSGKGEEHGKGVLVILVGAPGSGKSTFCETVMKSASRPWLRVSQATIGNSKAGGKAQRINSAVNALSDGKSLFIDRCNLDRKQRAEFVKLGGPNVDVHAVVLDLPAKLCTSRSVKRTGQGGKAAVIVNSLLQKKEWPKLSEGFSRITFCQNDSDVQSAINTYIGLGPSDTLPSGCFGQSNHGIMKFLKKVQVLDNLSSKEPICKASESVSLLSRKVAEEVNEGVFNDLLGKELICKVSENISSSERNVFKEVEEGDVPSLAFPSISTSDFQFDLEKASDVIVEKVEEFVDKIGSGRLVLVDSSQGSKILSLVKAKAAQKNIDSNKFLTFLGDITQLYSQGGLRCNVIANAANWRLEPGGGGTNAVLYSAAGPELEVATKELANSLNPVKALVVPLPSTSPLFEREGVTHVIHVLGPNMNPQRPNCLDNDYIEGCKVLRAAYSSLFEGFASIVRNRSSKSIKKRLKVHFPIIDQKIKRESDYESERNKKSKQDPDEVESIDKSPKVHFPIFDQKIKRGSDYESEGNKKSKRDPDEVESIDKSPKVHFPVFDQKIKRERDYESEGNKKSKRDPDEVESIDKSPKIQFPIVDQKIKRESDYESERNKKRKRDPDEVEADITEFRDGKAHNESRDKIDGGSGNAWGKFAHALYHIAMNPRRHMNNLLEITKDVVVMNAPYPKAQKHLLVLARSKGLECLADARRQHLQLLKTMHAIGLKWAEKFVCEDSSLVFRLGYHSAPSMRQLHLHVISQDFDSKHRKNKKNWNSFNSAFFLDSNDVIEEITTNGKAALKGDRSLLSMELHCNRCNSAHPNITLLKSHISRCRSPFPSTLLQNGRLIVAPTKAVVDS